MVRQCGGCGVDRAASGAFNRSCKTRSCPTCSWARSSERGEFLGSAFDLLTGPSDYAWRYIVLTIPYSPRDEEDLTAVALRSRTLLAAKLGKGLWKTLLKKPDAAMYRAIEVAHRGHVHLNLLYFGPSVTKLQVEVAAAAVDCRAGSANVQDVDHEPATRQQWARFRKGTKAKDSRGSKESLKRLARYITKGMESNKGIFDEEWLGGDNIASTIDPVLAARWEIATYRLQLVQRYGALRRLKVEKYDHVALQEQDEEVACGGCGTVGDWRSVARNTEDWIQRCHDVGWKALSRSVDSRAGPTCRSSDGNTRTSSARPT